MGRGGTSRSFHPLISHNTLDEAMPRGSTTLYRTRCRSRCEEVTGTVISSSRVRRLAVRHAAQVPVTSTYVLLHSGGPDTFDETTPPSRQPPQP